MPEITRPRANKLPLINAIGNVGSAAWMIASGVLCCDKIALIGMDYSYYIDTPFKQTQYYDVIRDRIGTKYLKFFYKKVNLLTLQYDPDAYA